MSAIDLGASYRIVAHVKDENGAAMNASTTTLTITLPDGTTATPAMTNPLLGTYQLDYAPAAAGHYQWDFNSTGPATSTSGSFDVRSAWLGIISLAEARAQLDVSAATDDEQLRWYIEACSRAVEGVVGPCVARTFSEVGRVFDGTLMLKRTPAISVTSLTAIAPLTTNYVTADVFLDGELGLVTLASGGAIPCGRYTVAYRAGRQVIPENIRLATAITAQHFWRAFKGMGSETFGPGGPAPMPLEARNLLADEKQPMLA